jgi:pimeloyl-ACP methyl ester carboxylesterase
MVVLPGDLPSAAPRRWVRTMVGLALFLAISESYAQPLEQPQARCRPQGVGLDSECLANGVMLHYVDWGGHGDDLVLLAGLDDSARIYDELGPMLAQHHHVIAVTRRGFGHSAIPPEGYDPATLALDLRELMKALGIKTADLVGHSISGLELTRVAVSNPESVRRLVYLDAATDKSPIAGVLEKDPLGNRAPPRSALAGFAPLIDWTRGLLKSHSPAIASNLRQCYDDRQGLLVSRTPPAIDAAVAASMFADHPDYRAIRAPALAIYSDYGHADQVPPGTTASRHAAADVFAREVFRPWQQLEEARFRYEIACGSVLELKHTGHYLFLERPHETAGWIDSFLSSNSPCAWTPHAASTTRPRGLGLAAAVQPD